MKQQEILKMSLQDIKSTIVEMSDQLMKTKLNHKISPLENPIQIRTIRRTIAKLQTELTKRKNQGIEA